MGIGVGVGPAGIGEAVAGAPLGVEKAGN